MCGWMLLRAGGYPSSSYASLPSLQHALSTSTTVYVSVFHRFTVYVFHHCTQSLSSVRSTQCAHALGLLFGFEIF